MIPTRNHPAAVVPPPGQPRVSPAPCGNEDDSGGEQQEKRNANTVLGDSLATKLHSGPVVDVVMHDQRHGKHPGDEEVDRQSHGEERPANDASLHERTQLAVAAEERGEHGEDVAH